MKPTANFSTIFSSVREVVKQLSGDPGYDPCIKFENRFLQTLYFNRLNRVVSEQYAPTISDKCAALLEVVQSMPQLNVISIFLGSLFEGMTDKTLQQNHAPCESANDNSMDAIPSENSGCAISCNEKDALPNQDVACNRKQDRELSSMPSKRKKPLRIDITKAVKFVSKRLDKIQSQSMSRILSAIERKYPHFEACQNCDLCDKAFRSLDLTLCSKKHGGNPCNDLGLYPHASNTYLSVLHSTRKVVVRSGQGFENPLRSEVSDDIDISDGPSDTQNSRKRTFADACAVSRQSRNEIRFDYLRDEERQQRLQHLRRVRNSMHWKLTPNSCRQDMLDAIKYFKHLKTIVPNYVVPSWGTCVSKVLFATYSIDTALMKGREIVAKKQLRKRQRYLKKRSKQTGFCT